MNAHAPIVLGHKQEKFCQAVVRGLSATAAYREAYGVPQSQAESNGPRLMGNDRVKSRIAQIQHGEAAARKITLPYLTGLFFNAYELGMKLGQVSAASQSLANVAKMHGFMVDKTTVDLVLRRPSASPESPDEMLEDTWLAKYGQVIEHTAQSPSITRALLETDSKPEEQNPDSISQDDSEISLADLFGLD